MPPTPQAALAAVRFPDSQPVAAVQPLASACTKLEAVLKQFWKAGDFAGASTRDWNSNTDTDTGGMDYVRVHPKFYILMQPVTNRFLEPFWRIRNAAGTDGGVIGVLEENFIEPAHDEQGFERPTVLSRLELLLKEEYRELRES